MTKTGYANHLLVWGFNVKLSRVVLASDCDDPAEGPPDDPFAKNSMVEDSSLYFTPDVPFFRVNGEYDDVPVYFSAEAVDAAIAKGGLTDGSLNGKRVSPPRATWPARWLHLQDPD